MAARVVATHVLAEPVKLNAQQLETLAVREQALGDARAKNAKAAAKETMQVKSQLHRLRKKTAPSEAIVATLKASGAPAVGKA